MIYVEILPERWDDELLLLFLGHWRFWDLDRGLGAAGLAAWLDNIKVCSYDSESASNQSCGVYDVERALLWFLVGCWVYGPPRFCKPSVEVVVKCVEVK